MPKPPIFDDNPGTNGNNAATLIHGQNDQNFHISEEVASAQRLPQSNETGSIVDGRQYIGESHWEVVLRDVCDLERLVSVQHLQIADSDSSRSRLLKSTSISIDELLNYCLPVSRSKRRLYWLEYLHQ